MFYISDSPSSRLIYVSVLHFGYTIMTYVSVVSRFFLQVTFPYQCFILIYVSVVFHFIKFDIRIGSTSFDVRIHSISFSVSVVVDVIGLTPRLYPPKFLLIVALPFGLLLLQDYKSHRHRCTAYISAPLIDHRPTTLSFRNLYFLIGSGRVSSAALCTSNLINTYR